VERARPERTSLGRTGVYAERVRSAAPGRRILHVDLDPFFVAVERGLDPSLRDRPVIIGHAEGGMVAGASPEARARGVHVGQSVAGARRLCPEGIFRPGDLETYARASDEVTHIALAYSRRVERPSADEAYVDLEEAPSAVGAAEGIKGDLARRLGLEASVGLASSRLAARVASAWAKPRGLLVVLPGYEESFLRRQPLSSLPDLPPHLEALLGRHGIETLGQLLDAPSEPLARSVGEDTLARLRAAALGHNEEAIAVATPPTRLSEELVLRQPAREALAVEQLFEGLVARAARRLRAAGLAAGVVSVEVRRTGAGLRREENVEPGVVDEATLRSVARALVRPLLQDAPEAVRSLHLRLGRLHRPTEELPLFPGRLRLG
jgi:DNA polymerase-4